jgi:hypothetical protein
VFRKRLFAQPVSGSIWRKWLRRFRRPLPLAFLALVGLATLGGALYGPSNYDAMAYRVPRVLHWLAEGRWHWIHTDFQRVNTRTCGIEWLSAPLVAFTKTDRLLFLINIASFLLLPGLIFSLFRQVGVKARTAWHWMWILPGGYCFVLQAGSISNDMFSTVYSLAAVDFALRARKSGRISEVCLSILSAALLTGAKTSNLPLLLPWAIALLPTWRIWLRHPVKVGWCLLPAIGASLVPMALMNLKYCGDWSGAAAEHVPVASGPMWLRLFANTINYTLANLVPPVFPLASAWNRLADAVTPGPLAALLQAHFEPSLAHWKLAEIQEEETASLGFGLTVLLVLSLWAVRHKGKENAGASAPTATASDKGLLSWCGRRGNESLINSISRSFKLLIRDSLPRLLHSLGLVCLAPWISLLFVIAMINFGGVRYLTCYVPLLIMGLLREPAQAGLTRRRWWQGAALLTCGLASLLLILSPARPLWPAHWFFQRYEATLRSSALGLRAMNAYEVKGTRAQVFAPMVALLPPDAAVVGFMANDYPETSLWKPFGSRRILHVKVSDSPELLRQRGLKYIVATTEHLTESWPEWLQRMNARELQCVSLKMWGYQQPYAWHLVELQTNGSIVSQCQFR